MRVSKKLIDNAKRLRINQIPWETKLWKHLRGNRFFGFKFKRQVPIGPYIVDLYCHKARLVIELDGGQHDSESIHKKDADKEKYLKRENFVVMRFWNNEIDENMEGVLVLIEEKLKNKIDNLSPDLSPHLERGDD